MTVGASAVDAAMTALITAVMADATFTGLCPGGAVDAVPQGVTFPYAWLTIREDPAELETFGRMGQEIDVRFQIFDKDDTREGTQRIDQIIARLAVLLHHATIAVSGWNMPLIHYRGAMPLPHLKDADGVIVRTKVATFRGLLEGA